jgi:hypothetical protein
VGAVQGNRLHPLALLVGLGAPERHYDAFLDEAEVLDEQGRQLAAAQAASEP